MFMCIYLLICKLTADENECPKKSLTNNTLKIYALNLWSQAIFLPNNYLGLKPNPKRNLPKQLFSTRGHSRMQRSTELLFPLFK